MDARQEAVRDTLTTLIGYMKAELPHQCALLPDAEVVLAEILNNVVKHGYGHGLTGSADISITLGGGELQIEVTDRGIALPDLRLPEGSLQCLSPAEASLADLPEGGFGWALIRMLAKQITYQRVGDENKLMVVIPFPEN